MKEHRCHKLERTVLEDQRNMNRILYGISVKANGVPLPAFLLLRLPSHLVLFMSYLGTESLCLKNAV